MSVLPSRYSRINDTTKESITISEDVIITNRSGVEEIYSELCRKLPKKRSWMFRIGLVLAKNIHNETKKMLKIASDVVNRGDASREDISEALNLFWQKWRKKEIEKYNFMTSAKT